ncbi:MAG: hypothetical protein ACM3XM_13565 [Mycobacterium leprae]
MEHAIGSVERPLSNADLEEKFRELADGILSVDRTSALIDLLWRVDTLADATEIVRAARA